MKGSSATLQYAGSIGVISPLGAICIALLHLLAAGSVGSAVANEVHEAVVVGSWRGSIVLPGGPIDIRVDLAHDGMEWFGHVEVAYATACDAGRSGPGS